MVTCMWLIFSIPTRLLSNLFYLQSSFSSVTVYYKITLVVSLSNITASYFPY